MGLFDKVHEMDIDRKINKKANKFFENEDYLNRLKIRYSHASIDLDKIKLIKASESDAKIEVSNGFASASGFRKHNCS